MVERLPSPPRWMSVVVDIAGGTTATEKERLLFFRDVAECWQFKFGTPTYLKSFEVVPRMTYTIPEEGRDPERIIDETPSGDWMHKMQV